MKNKQYFNERLQDPRVTRHGGVVFGAHPWIDRNSFSTACGKEARHFGCRKLASTFLAILAPIISLPSLMAADHANLPEVVQNFVEQKVIPDDGMGDDGFGYAVAVSGTTAMVGEAKALVNQGRGEVYVYARSRVGWIQTQKLTASDGAPEDGFGSSIAVSGNTAIIGAIDVNDDRGAVYIFRYSGGTWSETQKLTASDGEQLDWFGYAVAFSGTQLVVGARNARGDRGAAYFYDGSSGTWLLTAELSPADLQPQDYFGASVALSGTTALIGAFDINGHAAGAAYIFNYRPRGGWTQTAKLIPSDGHPGDWFGWSVALSDDTAVVGANEALINNQLNYGAVYVFNRSGDLWFQSQKLLASDGAEFGTFGTSVAMDGNTILVGAPGRPAAYLFTRSNGIWAQTAELMASDHSSVGGTYGWKAAFDGNVSLVSSTFSMVNGHPEGAAYFYRPLRTLGVRSR